MATSSINQKRMKTFNVDKFTFVKTSDARLFSASITDVNISLHDRPTTSSMLLPLRSRRTKTYYRL